MISRWRGACLRYGLALPLFSALFFFKPLEDAYVLPQRLGLALGALALALGAEGAALPAGPVMGLGAALFAWRFFCHFASPAAPPSLPWVLAQLPQFALFVAAAAALRDPALRRRAAAAAVAAGGLAAAYALLAPLGWDPFGGGAVDLGFGGRAHGSLGNPDFLGGWLAMLLPLGCMLGASAEGTARRWAAAATALMALALALTLARGAWLAGAAGCAAAVACGGAQRLRARQWLPWAAATALAAVLLAGLGPGSGALSARLKEAGDPRSDAWKSRVFMASVAWDLAKERPLFGVGGGAFEMEYLRRQGKRLGEEPTQPFRLTADAHNDWLQAAAETGFPGLALWAALFCAALWAAWRRGGPEGSALAGILVAFGVQGCFHFPWDIVPSAGLLLLALAATAGFGREEVWVPPRGLATLLSLAVAVCFALGLRQAGASALLNSGMSVQADAAARPLSADLFAAAARIDGDDERPWNRLGAEQMRVRDNAAAAKSYQQALQILPSSPDDWTNLGLCLGLQGQMPGAAAALRQAVLLNPRSNEAWADEANAVYQLGRKDEAIAIAREGIRQAGGSPQAWFNLGGMLYNGGQRAAAAAAFTRVLALDPAYPGAAGLLERCRHGR